MREISSEKLKIGEHVIIDGVEYIAEDTKEKSCKACALCNSVKCSVTPCADVILKKVREDKLMTNRQLAEWCAKGCGQWKHSPSNSGTIYHTYWVIESKESCFVEDNIVIRPWGTYEWVKPTLKIYEKSIEERKK